MQDEEQRLQPGGGVCTIAHESNADLDTTHRDYCMFTLLVKRYPLMAASFFSKILKQKNRRNWTLIQKGNDYTFKMSM